jgi:hypothetical protein
MIEISNADQLLALVRSLGENDPESTVPVTIERTFDDPEVLTIRYRIGTSDEALEYVHDDGRITS